MGVLDDLIKVDSNGIFTSGWMVRPQGQLTNNTPLAN